MAVTASPEVSAPEWEFVQDLLHDLQLDEQREELAYLFGQWRLSIRVFRRVESRRMTLAVPTETDLLFHRACVTDLISFGSLLEIAAATHPDEALAQNGPRRDLLKALLSSLRNSFDEWHGQVSEARLEQLSARIFDASPEPDLPAARA